MTNHQCRICEKNLEVDELFVGLPIIRLKPFLKSELAGSEAVFHVSCFLSVFKKNLELVK